MVHAARCEYAARLAVVGGGRGTGDRRQALGARTINAWHRAEQAPRVGVAGIIEDRRRRSRLDDAPVIHHLHGVGHLGDDAEVVGNQHDARLGLCGQGLDQLEDLGLDRDVERRRRLVGNQEPRTARQRHRDHQALALPTRELVWKVVDSLLGIRNTYLLHQLEDAQAHVFARK